MNTSVFLFLRTQLFDVFEGKGKVFYGQKHPRGESTTTVLGDNYQLATEVTNG